MGQFFSDLGDHRYPQIDVSMFRPISMDLSSAQFIEEDHGENHGDNH